MLFSIYFHNFYNERKTTDFQQTFILESQRFEALPGVLGKQGNKGIFFSGEQGNKGLKIKGTQAILGNRKHSKSRFCFGEQGHFFEGNKGTGTPTPHNYHPGRASELICFDFWACIKKIVFNLWCISKNQYTFIIMIFDLTKSIYNSSLLYHDEFWMLVQYIYIYI